MHLGDASRWKAEVEVDAGGECVFISIIVEVMDQYLYTMGSLCLMLIEEVIDQ